MTILMRAPTTGIATEIIGMPSGTVYQPNALGYVAAQLADMPAFLGQGFLPVDRRDNMVATVDPGATDDTASFYAVGSKWFNGTTGQMWECHDATANAAVWWPIMGSLIGRLLGANFNVTTDQPITMFAKSAYRITKITAKNASISLDTAVGGVYTALSKGGTAVVANTQVYSALTAAALAVDLTIASTPGKTVLAGNTPLVLALTTGQGAPATGDVYVYGDRYV